MVQEVYVDLFFLINFSMDFLCFFLTSRLLGDKLGVGRTIFACVLGGLYADLSLFLPLGGIFALALDVLVCALMCLIVYGGRQRYLTCFFAYVAVSMVLGGFMTALFSLLNRVYPADADVDGDGISAWLLLVLAVVSAVISLLGGRAFRRRTAKRYERIRIRIGDKECRLSAFCDSGNLLRDPVGGKPCVLVCAGSLETVLTDQITSAVRNRDVSVLASVSPLLAGRVRLIPAKTATGEGMLVALRVDSVAIEHGKSAREIDALVALCDTEGFGEGCDALLPSEILI